MITKTGTEKDRVDKLISYAEYIIDCLKIYRSIVEKGSCNNCKIKKSCEYVPKLGELVRYNCPFYERNEKTEVTEWEY